MFFGAWDCDNVKVKGKLTFRHCKVWAYWCWGNPWTHVLLLLPVFRGTRCTNEEKFYQELLLSIRAPSLKKPLSWGLSKARTMCQHVCLFFHSSSMSHRQKRTIREDEPLVKPKGISRDSLATGNPVRLVSKILLNDSWQGAFSHKCGGRKKERDYSK